MSISTIAEFGPESDRNLLMRRAMYTVTTLVLTAILALGVAETFGWLTVYGVDTATRTASGGGYDLEVLYPSMSRPALATPFQIEVSRAGGFNAPITVAVALSYFELWDENGLFPAPSAETTRGEWVDWEFDPPEGDTLTVYYDARIAPTVQSGMSGAVAVVEDGRNVVEVEFETEIRP